MRADEEREDGGGADRPESLEPMVTTSLRLPKPTMDALRELADRQGVRPTTLIRRWIEERLFGTAVQPSSPLEEMLRRVIKEELRGSRDDADEQYKEGGV